MKMGELCNRAVTIAQADTSVREVAELMARHHVGCVVIVKGAENERAPIGIVTDRDIVLQVVVPGLDPQQTAVSAIMTPEPLRAFEHEDVYDVLQHMRARGLRRVPVVSAHGVLQGIFTFDDLVEWTSEHMLELSRLIQREIQTERSPIRR